MPPAQPAPYEAKCNPECKIKCDEANELVDGKYDTAVRAHIDGAKKLGVCEVRRSACESCLQRLEDAGVITF